MSGKTHVVLLILTMGAVTQLLRFLPFAAFSKGTPKPVLYLGWVLPAAPWPCWGVLPEKRDLFLAGSLGPGGHCRGTGCGTPQMEAQHPPVHCGGHGGLYAAGAAGIPNLKIKKLADQTVCQLFCGIGITLP